MTPHPIHRLLYSAGFLAVITGAAALAGCMDREPAGPSVLAPRFTHSQYPGVEDGVPVEFKLQGPHPTDGSTVTLTNVGTGEMFFGHVIGGLSTVRVPATTATYAASWRPLRYANVEAQLVALGPPLIAPFTVANGQDPFVSSCGAVLYDPSQANNTRAFTPQNYQAVLAEPRALVQVTSTTTSVKLGPMSLCSTAVGNVRLRLVDEGGNPVSLPASISFFRMQNLSGVNLGIPCFGDPQRCALEHGLLDGQGTLNTNGEGESTGAPVGFVVLDARLPNGKTIVKPVKVQAGQTRTAQGVSQPRLAWTYHFFGNPAASSVPQIEAANAGWILVDGVTSNDLLFAVNGLGEGRYTASVVTNPGQKGSKTYLVEAHCANGTCVQVTSGKKIVKGVWSTAGTASERDGTAFFTFPLSPGETTACVQAIAGPLSSPTDVAPWEDGSAQCGTTQNFVQGRPGQFLDKLQTGGITWSVNF